MTGYIQGNLLNGEKIVYEAKIHWIVFFSISSLLTLFIEPLIKKLTTELAITNKRVVIKVGLISRKTVEMNLNKIESITVDQTILGRILGYGSIIINGTGGTKEPFSNIRDPLAFRRQYQQITM